MCNTAREATLKFIADEIEWRHDRLRQLEKNFPLSSLKGRHLRLYKRLQSEMDLWARRAHNEFRNNKS